MIAHAAMASTFFLRHALIVTATSSSRAESIGGSIRSLGIWQPSDLTQEPPRRRVRTFGVVVGVLFVGEAVETDHVTVGVGYQRGENIHHGIVRRVDWVLIHRDHTPDRSSTVRHAGRACRGGTVLLP